MQEKRPTHRAGHGNLPEWKLLLVSLTLLVCNGAGSLASRLAGSLAVAAAALSSALLQVCLVDGHDVLHVYLPPFSLLELSEHNSLSYYSISRREMQEGN